MPRLQHRLFTRLPFLIVAIILFAFSAEAQSTTDKWSNLGPERVDINCISVDPVDHNTIYVGTHAGVFKTTDGGQNWRNTYNNKGLPNMDIYSVDIDPVDHKILYLRTPYYVVKSTDGGDNWTNLHLKKVPSNTLELIPSQLIIDYVDHNTIFALADNVLMKTTDGGITWNVLQTGVQNDESIISANLDRYQHGTLYVGVRKFLSGFNFFNPTAFQDRVIQSYDSGRTWHELANTNVLVDFQSVKFNAANLLPDPDNNARDSFFVGDCDAYRQCQNVRCVRFGSARLFCDSVPSGPSFDTIFQAPGNKASYFEAYLSATLGISCFSCQGYFGVQFPFALVDYMIVDPTDTNTFYVKGRSPEEGLYKSTDGARTWTSVGKGLVNSTVRAVAVDPSNPGAVFAGGATTFLYGGLSKKNDDQSTFKPITDQLTQGKDFKVIAVDPHSSNIVLAADRSAIYRSADNGSTWSVAIDFSHHDVQQSDPIVRAIVFESRASDIVYAGVTTVDTSPSPGILKSTDGGVTWQPANAGLPSLQVAALVSETHSPGTLYASLAANGPGLFKTTDGGNSWQSVGLPCCGADVLAVDPLNPGTIYSFGGSFLKSLDYGVTWTRLMAAVPADRYQIAGQGIGAVAFDPLHPNTIYAATNTYPFRILVRNRDILFKGVFKSTNGGLSWWPSNDGLTSPFVTSLAADPSTGKLYAGTEGGGVFVTQPTQGPRTGDVNGDGKVDVRDLIALANGLAGNLQLDPFSADILADGKIDVQDLYALCQFLAGNVNRLPIAPSQ